MDLADKHVTLIGPGEVAAMMKVSHMGIPGLVQKQVIPPPYIYGTQKRWKLHEIKQALERIEDARQAEIERIAARPVAQSGLK